MARGRPLSFDRSNAVRRAMEVFWTKGYDGTQIADLTAAMGINPTSFYAAFGSKKELFCEAVDVYIDTIGSRSMKALDARKTVRSGLKAMMESVIDIALSNESGGCLLVLGVINNREDNRDVWDYLRDARNDTLALIQRRLERGVAEGDLPVDTKIRDLSHHFLGLTQTISFQARDGASRATLRRLIEPALAAIPTAEAKPA
ncbi:MAG: TetR/AcrR family transcriptional regulator [Alphaproteobacteria bacterium]|nr:TetR/AcrR family transcriptional regulator [Alphaproteobacteria bacterium]MBU2229942.1 TetR/AcrR family transcriptional regulator [Alphaproteobacteria bacterium]